ncbi:hypothetical protein J5A51_02545 [Prevotella fusca JCM 17724]|uniref:Gp5/Type VI secretion system Vgr protein OB-fold domain-containing protein n=1 Tax=Prevotella fusca JCM 17724 TaxID=1236517 RepID=A0ABX7XWR0_9BACT|nr:phage baseplate assembly protein V [Prevotella fusca]QUB86161.1 hypothetical protein J5A51_02545 [Prevotella fusca JCM 17724]
MRMVGSRVNAAYDGRPDYLCQYGESQFGFIRRLASQYKEWLYYDGTSLVFGRPKTLPDSVCLEFGTTLSSLDIGIQTLARPKKAYSYHSSSDQQMDEASPSETAGQDLLARKAVAASMKLFSVPARQYAEQRVNSGPELVDYMRRKQSAETAESHYVTAESRVPGLCVGSVVKIDSSFYQSFRSLSRRTLGEFIITEIVHEVGEDGYYRNRFKALPSALEVIPVPDARIPHAETQMATVTRNDDPKGSGRIQVRMNWQADDMNTNWIRVMTPDGGSSSDVKSNRGFVFIPEVGDHVLVGFRHGDPSRPYAMGSLFNGFTGKGGGPKNSIKSLRTRSGISVILNDDNRSLEIKDAGGSSIHLDGNGNILLNAPKNIQLHAGNDMSFMAGHDLQVNVGNTQTTNIGNMLLTNVMQKILVNTPFMQQLVADFFHTQAGKALLNSQNQIKIEAPETNVVGEQELFIHSANKTVVNSQGTMEMRGEQGMHELNTAKEYETVKEEIGTKVCVQFRTSESYSGEFGFDWVRFADSERTGDIEENRYDKIIGSCKGEGNNFKQKTNKYYKFLSEYKQQYIIPWKKKEAEAAKAATLTTGTDDGKKSTDYLYVVPVMTLRQGNSADLVLNIDVNEKAKSFKYEYDTKLFSLNKTTVKICDKGSYKGENGDTLRITCKQEFSEDKEICLYAYDGQENKSLAGKLIVKANDDKHRYALDVVLVRVKTCIKDNNISYPPECSSHKTILENYFAQCYIDANIKECELDLTTQERKTAFLAYTEGGYLKGTELPTRVFKYLAKTFNGDKVTSKYKEYHKIFFLNEKNEDERLYGQARKIRSKEVVVLAPGLHDTTCAHELFHALGLYHSFSSSNLHTFEKNKTDNIMDYSDVSDNPIPVVATWQFQWDILHKKLLTIAQLKKEEERRKNRQTTN